MIESEYQKTLIRMWDNLREDEDKMGKPNCDGVLCEKCPLYGNGKLCGSSRTSYKAYEIIARVEEWAEYHPARTNGTEFLKNFPNAQYCGYNGYGTAILIKLDKTDPDDGNIIEVNRRWWNERIDDDADCD